MEEFHDEVNINARRYVFQLPTILKKGDKITVKCTPTDEGIKTKELRFSLVTGCTLPDYYNKACVLIIKLTPATMTDTYKVEVVTNGVTPSEHTEELRYADRENYRSLKDNKFTIEFKGLELAEDKGKEYMDIRINGVLYKGSPWVLFHKLD